MGRYDKYRKAVKEEIAFNEEQDRLHEKHSNIDEDTIIIETSNMWKFLMTYLRLSLKTASSIMLVFLAAVGILTLIYPETRAAFQTLIETLIDEIKHLI